MFPSFVQTKDGQKFEVLHRRPPPVKPKYHGASLACPYCPKKCLTQQGLVQHRRTHGTAAKAQKYDQTEEYMRTVVYDILDDVTFIVNPAGFMGDLVRHMFDSACVQGEARRERDLGRLNSYRREEEANMRLAPGAPAPGRRGCVRRASYTAKQKLRIVDQYETIHNDTSIPNKAVRTEEVTGVPESNIVRWRRDRARLLVAAASVHTRSLLRVDRNSRKKAKKSNMTHNEQVQANVKRRALYQVTTLNCVK